MPGRGRRIAVALIVLALLLSAGRWAASFAADRFWEAGVSQAVAIAGTRRALISLALELSLLFLTALWFHFQLALAARIALPDRPPPERDSARVWPPQLPRWTLAVLAIGMAGVLGNGAGEWRDELLLSLDGMRLGVRDPLLSTDLGVFLRQLPLWLDLQQRAILLILAALVAVGLLHVVGETIRLSDRRLWIWPRARGQLAVLLALLALTLGWGSALESYRLAAGLRGPLLPSEFALRSLVAQIQVALALLAALLSFLWWMRGRGALVTAAWLLLATALLAGRGLPLRGDGPTTDPSWRSAARALDSLAFQLSALETGPEAARLPADSLVPTLWDAGVLTRAAAADSGAISDLRRGWIRGSGPRQPVWFAVRELPGRGPELLALSDTRVASTGALLAWRETDSLPTTSVAPYRRLEARAIRPTAERLVLATNGHGVALDSWFRRIVLAWALQSPAAFSAGPAARIAWRLDPVVRLRAVAPFAHWTPPRPRFTQAGLFWQSDGLLLSDLFPSSTRVDWGARKVSMVRSAFLGIVNVATGEVRIFRRDPADSLAAAWARIARPMIESPEAVPAELRAGDAYPEELLLAQAQVLEGAAWNAGRVERLPDGRARIPPAGPGGAAVLVPFIAPVTGRVVALLSAHRTDRGDSLRLIRLDTLLHVEGSAKLMERWKLFPFQQGLDDSVRAAGASFEAGLVRFALTREGVVSYQPAWALDDAHRATLLLVNVALVRTNGTGRVLRGTGRTLADAWRNSRGEIAAGSSSNAQAILEEARRLMLHADSARERGDLQERERTLAALRELLKPRRP